MSNEIVVKNKKATFQFEIVEKFTAGIVLKGTEIKSIRMGRASFVDSYCFFIGDELWVKGLHIAEYAWGTYNNHDPKQDRKLLLTRKELTKLKRRSQEKGLTIIALKLFINERGLAKVDIALARGKQLHDKRDDLREKDVRRELDRARKR
ncbi:MAG TPA: SsrA-binding protein SmpB [Tenuifilaceae bacterium]|jgi:SsrA-binding protein|nr:SsrA-binding protein SmpB [Bacteroidales bacterium]HNY08828.1 SsrA-binding protein SmpB [Tenuifilaceae bacterium]MBP8643817.1 SsrA-binding protein SmpB [Bacteroidales bacterium]NLI87114.1 SsrA-binding protein SmpB [Bacteroidales bacterium]HOA09132.1 SsrA-binding protein SmpB [Tenuifilaceae bacterium]